MPRALAGARPSPRLTPRCPRGPARRFSPVLSFVATFALAASMLAVEAPAGAEVCSSGAHTLSHFGDRVYPDMGNGGYTSLHTDVYLSYDAPRNRFRPGTHVVLTDQATQCLTDFSLDFERRSMNRSPSGPNMKVRSVTVDGEPARFTFVQPTYPDDPSGQDDPNPLAHAISNVNPVSSSNPNPPACSPQMAGDSQNGKQCPKNKLVITPPSPISNGSMFTVTVNYTGRPGVHFDGDGTTEGWFRVDTNKAPNDGSFVTTEPVASMAWMPLNNHPSAKPTYDFYDTTNRGKTAIANGELVSSRSNPPDRYFPAGSVTWHWHSPEPIASYLVENSIGSYDLTGPKRVGGVDYYEAQASAIPRGKRKANRKIMDMQPDITRFQSMFNGPFPFTTDGVIVGIPSASFEEEMQGKITFANSSIYLGTFHHENMHQWFGDNVAEAAFNLTFWKEGWATVGGYLMRANVAATHAGGMNTSAGAAAFDRSLIRRFDANYKAAKGFWTVAPSNPTVGRLFGGSNTYTRPGTAYLALRQILDASASRPGSDRWIGVMKQIQSQYSGGTITEPQLEAVFHQWLPNQSAACSAKLDTFFTQWFDTAYPPGGGANKPQITGPGLAGADHFYDDSSACARAGQAIAFGPLTDRSGTSADFTVSATADSGLPVSFSATGPCTVTGATVHLTGVLGSCTITASQAGDGVYRPAAPVSQAFQVH